MKVGHRNIKPCCKLPCYSRILNYRTCKIIFFQPNIPYVQSLLGTVQLLLWIKLLSCTFILNGTINHFEHFFSNCFNKPKTKTCNLLLFVRLWGSAQSEGKWHSLFSDDSEIRSPGYHFNKNTLLQKVIFVFLPTGLVLLNELFSNRMQRCIYSSLMTDA